MASVTPSRPLLQRQSSAFFDSVTHLVPPGHEKPVKQAFYTVVSILFLVLGCAAAVAVYFVLQVFIRPLLWAVLCGSFLFPLKYSLNSVLESWLKTHEQIGRPLIVGTVLLPFSLFDEIAERLGSFVVERWRMLVCFAVITSSLFILYIVQLLSVISLLFFGLIQTVVFLWNSTSIMLDVCTQYRIVIMTLVGAYFIIVLMFEPKSFPALEYVAIPAWILLLVCLASIAGSFRVPCGIALVVCIINGAFAVKRQKGESLTKSIIQSTTSIHAFLSPRKKQEDLAVSSVEEINEENTSDNSENAQVKKKFQDTEQDTVDGSVDASNEPGMSEKAEKNKSSKSNDDMTPVSSQAPKAGSLSELKKRRRPRTKKKNASTTYLNFLLSAFALALITMHLWLITLLVLPFIYWCLKRLLYHEVMISYLEKYSKSLLGYDLSELKNRATVHLKTRKNLLLPSPVQGMTEMFVKGDRKISTSLQLSLPTVTSIIMILILIIGSISISLFLAVKVQQESFLVVQMTSDFINETVSRHPDYKSWLPDNETMQNMMESLVDKVYLQGREWIKVQVQSNLGQDANVSLVEKQAIMLWDRAYRSWFNKSLNSKGSERKSLRRQPSSDNLNSGLFSGLIDFLNMSEVMALIKENISALKSVLESVLSVLQSNMSLVFSSITTVATILLNGGTAILNFLLSMVIFFTTLFYLLTGSDKQYMPVQLLGGSISKSSKPNSIATAIQDAISGVFGASLKMSSFYGLYTWLNHTTFGSNLVYIPSVLAAVFSVVPILTTYWSCIPAFIELWFLQGDLLRAFLLLFFQFLPTMFVDGEIYAEMAASGGGHPYITGLAVAGGLYYFGLEGAIIGPILLCILLVAINVYTQIMNMPANPAPLTSVSRAGPTRQLLKSQSKVTESQSESSVKERS